MNIAVAGVGYVGLVTAASLAAAGHEVTCIDIDEKKIGLLRTGHSPIYENGLEELISQHSDRLNFTSDCSLYSDAEIIIIGVGTPELPDGSANLSAVYAVADSVASYASDGVVVAVKSTVPVGTCGNVKKYIEQRNPKLQFTVVSNPEFLSQGTALSDTFNADRIVVGADDERSFEKMRQLYAPLNIPILSVSVCSSEMIKYASNDFLALKISYINEIANFCEIAGADIDEVSAGMGMDRRIGSRFLKAGIGYGGSCFPKDTKALNFQSDLAGVRLKTVKATIDINREQRLRLIEKARKFYPSFSGLKAAVLGLTFKPGTDDLREAPSIPNIELLVEEGAQVCAWDPRGVDNYKRQFPESQIAFAESIDEAITGADICFIMTEWDEVIGYPAENFVKYMRKPLVFDGRNCYNISDMMQYPIVYESIGRKAVNNIGNIG